MPRLHIAFATVVRYEPEKGLPHPAEAVPRSIVLHKRHFAQDPLQSGRVDCLCHGDAQNDHLRGGQVCDGVVRVEVAVVRVLDLVASAGAGPAWNIFTRL